MRLLRLRMMNAPLLRLAVGSPADYTLTFLFFTQNSKVERVELDSFYQTLK